MIACYRWSKALAWVLAVTGLVSHASASDELDKAEFERLQRELTPDATAPWRTIPWRVSLLDAQRVAAAEQKPIFIWAMDGHPLGCT